MPSMIVRALSASAPERRGIQVGEDERVMTTSPISANFASGTPRHVQPFEKFVEHPFLFRPGSRKHTVGVQMQKTARYGVEAGKELRCGIDSAKFSKGSPSGARAIVQYAHDRGPV